MWDILSEGFRAPALKGVRGAEARNTVNTCSHSHKHILGIEIYADFKGSFITSLIIKTTVWLH